MSAFLEFLTEKEDVKSDSLKVNREDATNLNARVIREVFKSSPFSDSLKMAFWKLLKEHLEKMKSRNLFQSLVEGFIEKTAAANDIDINKINPEEIAEKVINKLFEDEGSRIEILTKSKIVDIIAPILKSEMDKQLPKIVQSSLEQYKGKKK